MDGETVGEGGGEIEWEIKIVRQRGGRGKERDT